jgi:hypothetical protein
MTVNILPTDRNKRLLSTREPWITPCKDFEQNKVGQVQQDADETWTTEYSVDQLFLDLVRVKEGVSVDNGGIILVRKYYRQARQLLYWIPVARLPSNEFVICVGDLSPRIIKEIESIICTPTILRYVLTQAVGRIFENLDFEYYHLSVARNLRVRIEP